MFTFLSLYILFGPIKYYQIFENLTRQIVFLML